MWQTYGSNRCHRLFSLTGNGNALCMYLLKTPWKWMWSLVLFHEFSNCCHSRNKKKKQKHQKPWKIKGKERKNAFNCSLVCFQSDSLELPYCACIFNSNQSDLTFCKQGLWRRKAVFSCYLPASCIAFHLFLYYRGFSKAITMGVL